MKIVLIRHGETAYNAERRYQGHRDIPLNDTGVAQARALGVALQNWLGEFSGVRVYASDLERAARTAELALGRPADQLDARLRELSFGDFEGLTAPEIELRYGELYHRWLERPRLVTPPNAESLEALQARLTAWLDSLDTERLTIAFTHGGVIRTLLGRLDPGAATAIAAPCDRVHLWFRPDRRTLAGPPLWQRFVPTHEWPDR
jgi:broad specificity phosphatase PhoE